MSSDRESFLVLKELTALRNVCETSSKHKKVKVTLELSGFSLNYTRNEWIFVKLHSKRVDFR